MTKSDWPFGGNQSPQMVVSGSGEEFFCAMFNNSCKTDESENQDFFCFSTHQMKQVWSDPFILMKLIHTLNVDGDGVALNAAGVGAGALVFRLVTPLNVRHDQHSTVIRPIVRAPARKRPALLLPRHRWCRSETRTGSFTLRAKSDGQLGGDI